MTVDRTTETTEVLTGLATEGGTTEVAIAEEGMTEVVTIEEGMTALLEGVAAAVVPHPHPAHPGHGAPQQTTTHLTSLETGKRRQEQRGETKD